MVDYHNVGSPKIVDNHNVGAFTSLRSHIVIINFVRYLTL